MILRKLILLTILMIMMGSASGQIIIKVVAPDSIPSVLEPETEAPVEPLPDLSDFFISQSFIPFGGMPNLKLPDPMHYELISFRVKKYSKLKTFEIILHDYKTINKKDWYINYPELKELKKQRLIYEGDNIAADFMLLDSIAKKMKSQRKKIAHRFERNGYYVKSGKFFPTLDPVVSDFHIEKNENSDNFLLKMVHNGDVVSIPVGLLLETTSAKKIQNTYSRFYTSYINSLEENRLKREQIKEEHNTYLAPFTLMPLSSDFRTKEGQLIEPTLIHVVDYTADTVYVFNRMQDAFFDTKKQCAIVIVDSENRIGILKVSEFPKIQNSGWRRQLIFEMKPLSESTLEKLLDTTL